MITLPSLHFPKGGSAMLQILIMTPPSNTPFEPDASDSSKLRTNAISTEAFETYLASNLINSSYFYVVVTDMQGRYVYVNDYFKKRFSYISQNFLGVDSLKSVYEQDWAICGKAVEHCLRTGKGIVARLRKPKKNTDQEFLWTQWEFSPFGEKEQPLGVICIGHDITNIELMNARLRRYKRRIDSLLRAMQEGFYVLDADWKFRKVNHQFEVMASLKAKQVLGKTFLEVFDYPAAQEFFDKIQQARHKEKSLHLEQYFETENTWVELNVYFTERTTTVFFRDVSLRKQKAKELQESEQKLRAILDSTSLSYFLISKEGKLLAYNQTAESNVKRFLKKSLSEIGSFHEVVPAADIELAQTAFEGAFSGRTIFLEYDATDPETKRKVWFKVEIRLVKDKKGEILGLGINATDVTHRKKYEMQLESQNEKLTKIAHYQSHDIRRPVASALGLLSLIEEEILSEQNQYYFKLLRTCLDEADAIIHKIVGLASELDIND
ncbi:PAS domain S-box protein [Hugenholtzia roseola]|uniref:PAS domain S-box protein n=1 Tax=Hugenholtzia roseola TaxID=1002 RepID=UPI0004064FB4|nr:PAS domain S-box protein [Hugenholtzia roseola]